MGQTCWRGLRGYMPLVGSSHRARAKLRTRIEHAEEQARRVLVAAHEEAAVFDRRKADLIREGRSQRGGPTAWQLNQLLLLDTDLAARRSKIDRNTSVIQRCVEMRSALEIDTDSIDDDSALNDIQKKLDALHKRSDPLKQIKDLHTAAKSSSVIRSDHRVLADEKAGLIHASSMASQATLNGGNDPYAQQRAYFNDEEACDLLELELPTVPTRVLTLESITPGVVVLE